MSEEFEQILKLASSIAPLRIACDIPSGLSLDSEEDTTIFRAHHTMCMGAIKYALLLDIAKDFVGEIHIAELGVSRQNMALRA